MEALLAYEAELQGQIIAQREALEGLEEAICALGDAAMSPDHQELLEVRVWKSLRLTGAC